MDSKLRCAFEMPLENDKTVSTHSSRIVLLTASIDAIGAK